MSPTRCAQSGLSCSDRASIAGERSVKVTSSNLLALGVADDIVAEPEGGAHADWRETARRLKATLLKHLAELKEMEVDALRQARWTKYESMGAWLGEDAGA